LHFYFKGFSLVRNVIMKPKVGEN